MRDAWGLWRGISSLQGIAIKSESSSAGRGITSVAPCGSSVLEDVERALSLKFYRKNTAGPLSDYVTRSGLLCITKVNCQRILSNSKASRQGQGPQGSETWSEAITGMGRKHLGLKKHDKKVKKPYSPGISHRSFNAPQNLRIPVKLRPEPKAPTVLDCCGLKMFVKMSVFAVQ